MKLRWYPALVALLACATIAAFAPARAESPQKIAVVDLDVIMRDSSAAKGIQDQMKDHLEDFRKAVKEQEDKFRAEREDLVKQRNVLSPDAFNNKQRELEQKATDTELEFRRREQRIRQAGGNAQQELQKVLLAVVADVAKKEGVAIVMPKGALLYAGDTKDITKSALQQLNSKLPAVKVTLPK